MSETAQEIVAQEIEGEETEAVLGRLVVQPQFFETLQQMAVFASGDYNRPVLCSILVECVDNEMTMISTDTYRMMVRKIKVDSHHFSGLLEMDFTGSFLLDTTWLKKELPKIIKEQGGKKAWNRLYRIPLEIVRNNAGCTVLYMGHERNYEIPTIEGQFGNLKNIIKPVSDATSKLECGKQMSEALEWMSGIAALDNNRIAICAHPIQPHVKINYSEVSGGNVAAEHTIGGELSGEAFKIGFNCQYLIDFFNQFGFGCPTLHWFGYSWTAPFKRGAFSQELSAAPKVACFTAGEDVQYWIMPMCLTGEAHY